MPVFTTPRGDETEICRDGLGLLLNLTWGVYVDQWGTALTFVVSAVRLR